MIIGIILRYHAPWTANNPFWQVDLFPQKYAVRVSEFVGTLSGSRSPSVWFARRAPFAVHHFNSDGAFLAQTNRQP